MRLVSIVLLAVGLVLSGYLLYRHFQLSSAEGPIGRSVCSAVLNLDCDAALQSPISSQLGVSLAGWGIIYYCGLLGLILLGVALGDAFVRESVLLSFAVACVGAVCSAILLVLMLSRYSPFCPLCAATHAVNFALVPVLWRCTGLTLANAVRSLPSVFQPLTGKYDRSDILSSLKLLALFISLLLPILMYQWLFIQELRYGPSEPNPFDAVASYAMSVRVVIPEQDDPALGPEDADINLVVFTDFQCPGCRRFAHELDKLIKESKATVRLVFKHFPVSTACNRAATKDRHPQACHAAVAAEAARLQGKFWPYHDQLFAADRISAATSFEALASAAGLDVDRFRADLADEALLDRVKQNIELGIQLGVDETPVVFLNGRRAPDIRTATLKLLIISELAGGQSVPLAELPGTVADESTTP